MLYILNHDNQTGGPCLRPECLLHRITPDPSEQSGHNDGVPAEHDQAQDLASFSPARRYMPRVEVTAPRSVVKAPKLTLITPAGMSLLVMYMRAVMMMQSTVETAAVCQPDPPGGVGRESRAYPKGP